MILLTGASGFIGRALSDSLYNKNVNFRSVVHGKAEVGQYPMELCDFPDWSAVLLDQQVVIHTAGRAHMINSGTTESLSECRRVNVDGTLHLAHQAASAGVKRFIFLSSINVNGVRTPLNDPFTADSIPTPVDATGISKFEAEQGLQQLAESTGMEVVIIRPPLVYGPGVKGNFASMVKLIEKGIPLPFGAIHNQRSLVAIDNLVDLIITCVDHPAAANQVFLAGDGHDLSTSMLLQSLAKAMGRPARLLPISASLLKLASSLLGKREMADRLLGSLQVDISKSCNLLGWKPRISPEDGFKRYFELEQKK